MYKNLSSKLESPGVDFITHSLHVYPAKFPPSVPRFLLDNYAKRGDLVLDPFCGSGTTLVESRLKGIDCVGVDVNGLAALLSKVKATPLSPTQFMTVHSFRKALLNHTFEWGFIGRPKIKIKRLEGVEHWFQGNVAEELTVISRWIEDVEDKIVQDYLRIVLSSIIVKVSNQESDTRFAAISKNLPDGYAVQQFLSKLENFTSRFETLVEKLDTNSKLTVVNADSRDLNFIESGSINLIITSPPYANTYDYYLYHKFRKRWLDLDVRFAQFNEIGSRREYSSLKKSPQKWKDDLLQCFAEMNRVLVSGGLAFIVIGDSIINKTLIKIDEVIRESIQSVGFVVDDIHSSALSHKSSLFNPQFAKKGKKEHLIQLRKIV